MEKRVAMKDIASRVGVSIALVSYVMNNKEGRVGTEIAEKIRMVAKEMNYRPNLIAKSLQSGHTHTLGLIVADISNPFFSHIARRVEEEAKAFGYTVLVGSSDEDEGKSLLLLDSFLNRQVDGLIIAPAAMTEAQMRALQRKKVPFVLIDRYFPSLNVNSIRINNYQAAYDATAQLIKAGREKIAMLAYDADMPHFLERIRGYRVALKEGSRPLKEILARVAYRHMASEVGDQLERWLYPKRSIDTIFFATHSLAIEGLRRINGWGIRVPEDLAVISFDENDAFDLYSPPISFIRQPLGGIAREAVKLVLENIRQPVGKHTQVVLDAELVLRKSC